MGETWISRDFPQLKTEIVTMSQTQNPVPVCEEHSCKNLLVMRWVVAVQSVFLMFIGYQIVEVRENAYSYKLISNKNMLIGQSLRIKFQLYFGLVHRSKRIQNWQPISCRKTGAVFLLIFLMYKSGYLKYFNKLM